MTRPTTGGQYLAVTAGVSALLIALTYGGWWLSGYSQNADRATFWAVIGGAALAGVVLSTALLRLSAGRAVRRFEGTPGRELDILSWLQMASNASSGVRALAIRQLSPAMFEDSRACEALLDFSDDDRLPELQTGGASESISVLARHKLLDVLPYSGQWSRAIVDRLSSNPQISMWIAPIVARAPWPGATGVAVQLAVLRTLLAAGHRADAKELASWIDDPRAEAILASDESLETDPG